MKRFILCFLLLSACGQANSITPSPSATTVPLTEKAVRTSQTDSEQKLDAFIAARAKLKGEPVIAALEAYHQKQGRYPKQLSELENPPAISFDISDYDLKDDSTLERYVFDKGQPKRYAYTYEASESGGYRLILDYTVLDLIRQIYASESKQWTESRVF